MWAPISGCPPLSSSKPSRRGHCSRSFEQAHFTFIVMEYFPGGDRFDMIMNQKRYASDGELVRSGRCPILPLSELGIYNRDLKPET